MHTHLPDFSTRQARRARSDVVDDLRSLAHHARELLEVTTEDLTDQARQTREDLRSALDHIRESYGDWRGRGLEVGKEAAARADAAVREYPYQSLGVAFGLGLLVGLLIRRR